MISMPSAATQPFHRYYLMVSGPAYIVYSLFTLLLQTRKNILTNIEPLTGVVGTGVLGWFWVSVGIVAVVVGVTGRAKAVAFGFAAISIPPLLWGFAFLVSASWGPMTIWLLMGIQILIAAQMVDPPRGSRILL